MLRDTGKEAMDFIRQELAKVTVLNKVIEWKIIVKTMKRFGLSEETVAGLMHKVMQNEE